MAEGLYFIVAALSGVWPWKSLASLTLLAPVLTESLCAALKWSAVNIPICYASCVSLRAHGRLCRGLGAYDGWSCLPKRQQIFLFWRLINFYPSLSFLSPSGRLLSLWRATGRAGQVGHGRPNTATGSMLECMVPGPMVAAMQSSSSPSSQVLRAKVLAQQEKHEEAITAFEAAIAMLTISGDVSGDSQAPSTPPPSQPSESKDMVKAMVGKGISLGKLGRSAAAEQAFDAALDLDRDNVEALTYLGLLRCQGKRIEEGLSLYRRARELDPSFELASEGLARALTDEGTRLMVLGQADEAMSKYTEASQVCPSYAPAYYNEGIVLAERGLVHEALNSYARALELCPRYAEAHNNRGVLLKGLDRLPEAIEAYRACLDVNPNFELGAHNLALALSDLGTAVKAQGRVQEAIHLYQQALHYNATSADVMYNLAVAYVEDNEPLKASIWY